MSGHSRRIGILTIVGVLALPVIVAVQSDGGGRGPAAADWPTVGGDWGNMRYSPLNQITTQNVSKLGGAWLSQKFDQAASSGAMPVVKDGLIFVTVPYLATATGSNVWRSS
jgi:glucose dehydrogenase